jgi:ATP-dependent helicase/nuclease subunit A
MGAGLMRLTPEQKHAITVHNRNLIVVAGAGSGKTYVLVERYLSLLDAHPDWPLNALVAITFTQKAAQEMRDRVRQHLEERLRQPRDDVAQWQGRLTSMDSARIDTIHGLCATILRANAAEAGIDPDFEVLDEVDARILLETVIDDVLHALVVENDPAALLLSEYDTPAVRDALAEFASVELDELPPDMFEQWQAHWRQSAEGIMRVFIGDSAVVQVLAWKPEAGWPLNDKLSDTWEEVRTAWDKLNENIALRVGFDTCLTSLRTLKQSINLKVGSANAWGGKEQLQAAREPLRLIRTAVDDALDSIGDPPQQHDRRAAELLPLWMSLIRRVQAAYNDAKEQQGALDFDDLETRTRHLLKHDPQVRARYLRAEFQHVLVDEFQDTNAAQWDIVRALADPEHAGSLFVVGDEKQSIYGFRGADVSVFDQVRRRILDVGGTDVALVRSFRSHQRLIDCLNTVFVRILVKTTYNFEVELGRPLQAERAEAPCDASVLELLLLDEDMAGSAEQCRRWEAIELTQRLRHIVEVEQRPVFDKKTQTHRSARFGDIALLFQSTSNITLYEDVFKGQRLPFVTVAGRGYYSRQEVWDLINLLKVLHNPGDNLSLAAVLRSPLFSLSDDALLALRLLRGENGQRLDLWAALDQPQAVPADERTLVAFARDCLYDLRQLAGRVTISELLRETLIRTGYLATLTGLPDGARRRGNVEKLLEKAQTSGKVTLGAFSQYLRDLSAREVREGEALVDDENAVTLMTVHASKGLEFPIVVLVDASWKGGNRRSGALIHDPQVGLACKVYDTTEDQLERTSAFRRIEHLHDLRETAERRRLLYVAATRAQDYLLVSGQISPQKDGSYKTSGWLKWLWDALQLDGEQRGAYTLDRPWGTLSVHIPAQLPADDAFMGDEDSTSAWDSVKSGHPLPGEVIKPELLNDVVVERDAPARHLTATQIADLGSVPYGMLYRNRFRRSVLHDAPSHIEQVSIRREGVSRRILGEIVHAALRWGHFPTETNDLEDILQSYAWEQGIVDTGQRAYAVQEARELLRRTMQSDVYTWLQQAKHVYRELPFIYKTDRRTIHGVIDVLLQNPDRSWRLLDYKTSHVPDHVPGNTDLIVNHARRYYLQIGVYAAAVREQLGGVVPDVYIHYIRYWQAVAVPTEEWQAALASLEQHIGDLVIE